MIIPALITISASGLAWIAIVLLFSDMFYYSVIAALLAFLVDCFDGYVARKMGLQSDFGRQLDSLSDAIIYLIYPSLFYYYYFNLNNISSVGVQIVFIGTGIFRLARFNSKGFIKLSGGNAYSGLPVVFSFLSIAALLVLQRQVGKSTFSVVSNILILTHSFLMVREFPFPKPKTSSVAALIALTLLVFILYGKNLF